MYGYMFVLVTDDIFGVFDISASNYPQEFFENLDCVKKMGESDIKRFLLENVGRNILRAYNYDIYLCKNKIYPRKVS